MGANLQTCASALRQGRIERRVPFCHCGFGIENCGFWIERGLSILRKLNHRRSVGTGRKIRTGTLFLDRNIHTLALPCRAIRRIRRWLALMHVNCSRGSKGGGAIPPENLGESIYPEPNSLTCKRCRTRQDDSMPFAGFRRLALSDMIRADRDDWVSP